jgi:hypothetical protein
MTPSMLLAEPLSQVTKPRRITWVQANLDMAAAPRETRASQTMSSGQLPGRNVFTAIFVRILQC